MKKEIVFIDMDDVLADFQSGLDKVSAEIKAQYQDDGTEKHKPHFDDIPGLFSLMEPMKDAHKAVEELNKKYDLYILSTAPWKNASAWSDKLEWIKKYFGDIKRIDEDGKEVCVFYKRIIISHHKDLCCKDGAYLIDDRPNNGAEEYGRRWLHFGPKGDCKDWDEVVDYLMHRFDGEENIESFCENHGFVFHSHGHGKWGAFPFYSFEKTNADGSIRYSIEYTPFDNKIKIGSPCGSFQGHLISVADLISLLESMQIEVVSVQDQEQSKKTAKDKQECKMKLANRIATQIKIKYGFRDEKCLDMAMHGDWWLTTNHLSQMSNRNVDAFVSQVIEEIKSGKII